MTTTNSAIIQLPDWLLDLKEPMAMIQRTARTGFMVGRFHNSVRESFFKDILPQLNKEWVNGMLFVPALSLPFSIPDFINNTYAAITSNDTVDKAYHAAKATLDGISIVQAATSILSGLKEFGKISKETLPWAPALTLILFPVDLLGLDAGISHIYRGIKVKKELDEKAPKSRETDPLETRVSNITQSCQYVVKNKKKLSASLNISEGAAIGKMAKNILSRLSSQDESERLQAVQDGEAMMKTLRGRAQTKIDIGIASSVVKVAALITTSTLLIAAPTPVGPFAIAGAVTVAISAWMFERTVLNGDPFKPSEGISDKIRQAVRAGGKEVRKMNKKVVQYARNFERNMRREFENTKLKIERAVACC